MVLQNLQFSVRFSQYYAAQCTAGLPFIGPGQHTIPNQTTLPHQDALQYHKTITILASGAWSRLNQLMKRGSDEQIGSKFGHTMGPHTNFREKYRRSSDAHFLCLTACTQKVSHFPRHLSRICSFQLTDRIQSGASSLAKHGGAYFSAVFGSIQDPIATPGPYENQEP